MVCVCVSVPASIETSDVISKPEVIVNETITLFCPAAGVPPPEVTWFRDQQVLDNQTDDGIVVLDDGWRLHISSAGNSHASRYSCRAENIAGISEKHFDLTVLGKSKLHCFSLFLKCCMSVCLSAHISHKPQD